MSALLPFFHWCDATWVGATIRDSRVLFPIIETFHLLGLTLLLGAMLLINLRLFGLVMRQTPVTRIARPLFPWMLGSLAVMLGSGVLLFFSEAMKCYGSSPFRLKMILLSLAILFQFTIYRKVTTSDGTSIHPLQGALVGLLSLMLWFGVGLAGRAIGFY